MATEVEIDPSFQLKPDSELTATQDMPQNTKTYADSNGTRKSPRKKSLMGVFKKKKNMQYETMEDTPATAPSTPEGNEDLEIDLTVNVVSAAGEDPAFGFDADDNNNMMAMDVPDIFPHEGQRTATSDDQNQIVQPAQFKVPTQFEPELEVVLDDTHDKQLQKENEQARKHLETAHQQVGLVSTHTNDLAKDDAVFCTPLNGFYEEPPKAQQPANGFETAESSQDPPLQATKQRAVITTSDLGEEYARHENFEVVLDPSYYSPSEKNGFSEKRGAEAGRITIPTVDNAALEIQRDLEGFERQMKEESREEKSPGTQLESKQLEPLVSHEAPRASPSPLDAGSEELPMGVVEVSIEEPPEVKISVETQPAVQETKPKKEKKSRKMNLGKLTKKVKAMSSRASVKALSSKASKVLKSVPTPVLPSKKDRQEFSPSAEESEKTAEPEKPTKPKALWRAVEDPNSGKFYYYHRNTRETTWSKPQEYMAYEGAMAKYERDRISYEKYHHKPIEELVIDTSINAEGSPSGQDDLSNGTEDQMDDDEVDRLGLKNVEYLEEEPFDEGPSEPKPFDEAYDDPRPLAPLGSQGRVASQFSTMTEKTERINNVTNGSQISHKSQGFSGLEILDEDKREHQSEQSFSGAMRGPRAPRPVPRVSSSHRTRELRVEDLGGSRIAAETFDRRGRVVKGRELSSNEEVSSLSERRPANGTFDQDDTISGLSDVDMDYNMRRDNFNNARHRALDDAIERKDGDLFKALMAGMKASGDGIQKTYPGWNQSEVDRMIARDDWDTVRSYVSAIRGVNSMPHLPTNVAPARFGKNTTDEVASLDTDYSV
ncbi:unnamed protein product [Cylindrotheca closterium]|uniref:WW domain-containing protein n=1 Tax=Cylindrotheca closterium TaxID=2856 RepID=A0AAD2FYL0_9STRA|nr:unnamed protein product [Cylindrotheca closterium]